MIDTSGMSPRSAREAACVTEMVLELRNGLLGDVASHARALRQKETVTSSPLQKLKMECMARLILLIEFHGISVETMLKLDTRCAIAWAIDQAALTRMAQELASIDCGLIPDNPQEA